MDQIAAVFDFIGNNESLFSGIAAILAIVGVVFALLVQLKKHLTRASPSEPDSQQRTPPDLQQEIHYTNNAAGQRIAWTSIGEGTPLVRCLGWFTHLEKEWSFHLSRECVAAMAENYRYIRYDARGMGLSSREVDTVSPETRLEDLEAVMDAAGVERAILLGQSEGGTTAINYAAKHPERVSHLVLVGSFLQARLDPGGQEQWRALSKLIPTQWGTDNARFLQLFTTLFLPDANAEQNRFFNDMQRMSSSAEMASITVRSIVDIDVTETASSLKVPTLVLHKEGDLVMPIERGREIAATIPGARFVQLPGANHWLFADTEAFDHIVAEINKFVGSGGRS